MRAAWRIVLLFGTTILYTSIVALILPFIPPADRPRFQAKHQRAGSVLLCRIFGIRIRKRGRLQRDTPTLIVCNHFGILDPFVLATVMETAFVGKAEIRSWPLFGWVARVYGVIFVYRDRTHSVGDFVQHVRERMRTGVPVLVFPEGTTTADESVQPFKTGSFAAGAGMHDAVIQPVYLRPVAADGQPITAKNRRMVTWAGENEPFLSNLLRIVRLRTIEMEVSIGPSINAGDRSRKELADEARRRVIALRDRTPVPDTFPT